MNETFDIKHNLPQVVPKHFKFTFLNDFELEDDFVLYPVDELDTEPIAIFAGCDTTQIPEVFIDKGSDTIIDIFAVRTQPQELEVFTPPDIDENIGGLDDFLSNTTFVDVVERTPEQEDDEKMMILEDVETPGAPEPVKSVEKVVSPPLPSNLDRDMGGFEDFVSKKPTATTLTETDYFDNLIFDDDFSNNDYVESLNKASQCEEPIVKKKKPVVKKTMKKLERAQKSLLKKAEKLAAIRKELEEAEREEREAEAILKQMMEDVKNQ